MTDLIEVLARAYDPVGWAWYDKVTAAARETGATHPAAMGFFADKMLRAGAAALAVLDAVRMPTPQMMTEGGDEVFAAKHLSVADQETATCVWIAMIDALRSELVRPAPTEPDQPGEPS